MTFQLIGQYLLPNIQHAFCVTHARNRVIHSITNDLTRKIKLYFLPLLAFYMPNSEFYSFTLR